MLKKHNRKNFLFANTSKGIDISIGREQPWRFSPDPNTEDRGPCKVNINAASEFELRGGIFYMWLGLMPTHTASFAVFIVDSINIEGGADHQFYAG